MSLPAALALLLAAICAGAFAVRAGASGRKLALAALLGLFSTIILAAGLIAATEGTADIARILGLLSLLVGTVALAGGSTVLAQAESNKDDAP